LNSSSVQDPEGMAALFRKCAASLETAKLEIEGTLLPITLKRHARARRMTLRLDRKGTGLIITIPRRGSHLRAVEFAKAHSTWIRSQLLQAATRVPFVEGALIPLHGTMHEIRRKGTARGPVEVVPPANGAPGRIEVCGEQAHLARRLCEWLKAECKKELTAASIAYAEAMGVRFRKLVIRDQSSRWGSCSYGGQLSYSWRLILAPRFVLDYVAAHEVAHLAHMNHGPKFWALLKHHCPDFGRARAWMKRHGRDLHGYGV
jgi:predicted metal-dependent hydrolase